MNTLPLWKRCRALANPLRLDMLHLLEHSPSLCVKQIAKSFWVSEEVACKNLQMMATAGFMAQERDGKYLYYTLEEQEPLIPCILKHGMTNEQVIFTVTALTHERRVLILKTLISDSMTPVDICRKTGISMRALERQLKKLERRGFLRTVNRTYELMVPDNALGRRLVGLAIKNGTPAQVCQLVDG